MGLLAVAVLLAQRRRPAGVCDECAPEARRAATPCCGFRRDGPDAAFSGRDYASPNGDNRRRACGEAKWTTASRVVGIDTSVQTVRQGRSSSVDRTRRLLAPAATVPACGVGARPPTAGLSCDVAPSRAPGIPLGQEGTPHGEAANGQRWSVATAGTARRWTMGGQGEDGTDGTRADEDRAPGASGGSTGQALADLIAGPQPPLYHADHADRYDRQQLIGAYEREYGCKLVVVCDALFGESVTFFEELVSDASE